MPVNISQSYFYSILLVFVRNVQINFLCFNYQQSNRYKLLIVLLIYNHLTMKNITLALAISSLVLTTVELDVTQSCPKHEKLVKGKCVCKKGYVRHNGHCQRCPDYAYYDCAHNTCKCEPGYDWIQEKFICWPSKKEISKPSKSQPSFEVPSIPAYKVPMKPQLPSKPSALSMPDFELPSQPSMKYPSMPQKSIPTKYETETTTESKSEYKPEIKIDLKPVPKPEYKPNPIPQSKFQTKSETTYESKSYEKPAPKPTPKPQPVPMSKSDTKSQTKTQYKPEPKPVPKPIPPKKPAYNTPGSCPPNSFYNPPAYRCDCNYGWMWDEWGINCIPRCGVNQLFAANSCRCFDGYVKHFGEKCVTCPPGSHLNPPAYRCDCDNYGWVWNQNGTKCHPPKW